MEHQSERALIPLSFINFLTSAIEWVEMEHQPERALIRKNRLYPKNLVEQGRNGASVREGIDTFVIYKFLDICH